MAREKRILQFQDFILEIDYPTELALEALGHEFTYFDSDLSSAQPHFRIVIEHRRPDLESFGFLRPSFYTPRNICYVKDGKKIVNYHGQALLEQDRAGREVRICSENQALLESIAYTVILYQAGSYFDSCSLFRVHALGFSYCGKGVLVLLPMGGGKSTLLLELLRDSRVKLLSEDIPLIDSSGLIYPFPVKIGVLPGRVPEDIPPEYVRQIRHLEGTVKEVIDLAYFRGKIDSEPVRVSSVLLGERYLGPGVQIKPISRLAAWKRFFRDCVVGLGVYQGLEFAVTARLSELFKLTKLGVRRGFVCSRFVRKASCYEFQMGNDVEENVQALLRFLEER